MISGTFLNTSIATLACLATFTATLSPAAVSFRTVVMTGDVAPGVDPAMMFSRFWLYRGPAINEKGLTAFRVDISEYGQPFGSGVNSIWREDNDTYVPIVLPSTPATGTEPQTTFGIGAFPLLNTSGHTAFLATLSGPDVTADNKYGIWSSGSGTLELVQRMGDPAPGTEPGTDYVSLSQPAFNEAGQTAFRSELNGTGTAGFPDQGIWLHTTGAPDLVTRNGNPAPDTPTGTVFLGFDQPKLNDQGQLMVLASTLGPEQGAVVREGLWSGAPNNLELVAIQGAQAPHTVDGVVFDGVPSDFVINNEGQTAFNWGLSGPGVDSTNSSGIWLADSQSTELVVRGGQAAPDTEPQTVFSGFNGLLLNGKGHTLFEASLAGPGVDSTNNRGIWHKDADTLRLIARTGDHAPGTGPGVVFQSFQAVRHAPPGFLLNSHGQIAFQGNVTGTDSFNGIWATDRNGNLQLVVRAGDLFDVNDDPSIEDLRTVLFVNLMVGSGGEDGRPTSFNDAGQLAMNIEFTDGYGGIFVATIGLPGDLDGDGFVGIADLNLILANWNQSVPPADPAADPSGDGYVGIDDLNTVLGHWNTGTPPTTSVNIPEPATLVVLGFSFLARNLRLTMSA